MTMSFIFICILISVIFVLGNVAYSLQTDEDEYEKIVHNVPEFKNQTKNVSFSVGYKKNNQITRYEKMKEDNKTCIVRKEYYICSYCGSRSETTSPYCKQCGAPMG